MQGDALEKAVVAGEQRHVLAIDLGSSGLKAALVSETGRVVASARAPITTRILPGGGAEQDAEGWWRAVLDASKKVVGAAAIAPEKIIAVACDSQWSVVVPVNENGEPLMNAVHWMDTRGGPYNRRIAGGFPGFQGYGLYKLMKWIRLTGMAPTRSGVDSLGHVLYIKHEYPDVYARTFKFLEPMDYLTARLTGKISATQKTMAPFVIVDNRRWGSRQYSDELLKLAGVEKDKLPELLPNDGVVGTLKSQVADELGLKASTAVICGIADSNASLIGSGAVGDFQPIIYIGTSLYLTCHVPGKKTDIRHTITTLPSAFADKYYLLGEQGTGGRCLEYFLDSIVYPQDGFGTGSRPEDAYRRFDAVAARAGAGSGGVIFLPWLNGSLVPCEDPYVRAGFVNLSLKTDRSHLARAVMEALAYNNRWTRGPVEAFIGRKIGSFRFSGGGALSDLWAQIHADVLGVPVHQLDDPINTTVRGTALLAFITLGYLPVEKAPELVKVKKVFEPDESNRGLYDRMYARYRQLFTRNRGIFRALNRAATES